MAVISKSWDKTICGALIDNRNNAHIYVIYEYDRDSKVNLKSA